jgi:hypothetical protein
MRRLRWQDLFCVRGIIHGAFLLVGFSAFAAPASASTLCGFVAGGGHLGDDQAFGGAGVNDQDTFSFMALPQRDGTVVGDVQNTTHEGDFFHGGVTFLRCWKDEGPGPEHPMAIANNAEFGGFGTWNGEVGYGFSIHVADRAEGGRQEDEYESWIWDDAGNIVYSQTMEDDAVIAGGNIQIMPPNRGHSGPSE